MSNQLTPTTERASVDRVFCRLAGPGRGDCAHAVGVPAVLDESTCDAYGIPYDWCDYCWAAHLLAEARRDAERFREEADSACTTVAQMHEAARGEVAGPRRGVVEDVLELAEIARGLAEGLLWTSGELPTHGQVRHGWRTRAEVWLDRYRAYRPSPDGAGR